MGSEAAELACKGQGDKKSGNSAPQQRVTGFTVSGVFKLAFSEESSKRRRASCKYIDARACVSDAALAAEQAIVAKRLAAKPPWLYIERCFDETPVHLAFGDLTEVIAPAAMYYVPAGAHRDLLGKPLCSFKESTTYGIKRGRHGIVDVMEMTVAVCFGQGQGMQLTSPPRIMAGKSANHVLAALDTVLGSQWSVEQLRSLASEVPLVLLTDVADSAAANRKALHVLSQELPKNVLHWAQRCSIHQMFRSIVTVLKRLSVMNPLYCLTNVLRITSKQEKLAHALSTLVRRRVDYRPGLAPPPADSPTRAHAEAVLDRLVWRRAVRDDSAKLFANCRREGLQEKIHAVKSLLQGPWWQQPLVHFCPGSSCICGGSRSGAIQKITEVLMWLLVTTMPATPTFSRWSTLGPCIAWLALGVLLHDAFTATWSVAFSEVEGAEDNAGNDEEGLLEFQRLLNRRVRKCSAWLCDAAHMREVVTTALVTEPLDNYVLQMLSADAQGSLVKDLVSKGSNPVRPLLQAAVGFLEAPSAPSDVFNIVARHFSLTAAQADDQWSAVRAVVIELCSSAFYRCQMYYSRFPFKLLWLVAGDRSEAEKRDVALEFVRSPQCELDLAFSGRLQALLPQLANSGAEADLVRALRSSPVIDVLGAWASHGKVSIASVERQHAKHKHLWTRLRTKLTVERAMYDAHLRGMMADHLKRGGGRVDHTLAINAPRLAEKAGLQLRRGRSAAAKRRAWRPDASRDRLKIRYIGFRCKQAKLFRSGRNLAVKEERASRRQYAVEFDALSPAERSKFAALHAPPVPILHRQASDDEHDGQHGLLDEMHGDSSGSGLAPAPPQFMTPDVGDSVWPLSEQLFREHLSSEAAKAGASDWRGGLHAVSPVARARHRQRQVIQVKGQRVPAGAIRAHLPCCERHPGLCSSRDRDVYRASVKCAQGMHRTLGTHGSLGGFYRIRCQGEPQPEVLCFATVRQRDPPLAVFALAGQHDDKATLQRNPVLTPINYVRNQLSCFFWPRDVGFKRAGGMPSWGSNL